MKTKTLAIVGVGLAGLWWFAKNRGTTLPFTPGVSTGGDTAAPQAKFTVGQSIQYAGNSTSAVLKILAVTDRVTVTGHAGGSYLVQYPNGTQSYFDIQTADATCIAV